MTPGPDRKHRWRRGDATVLSCADLTDAVPMMLDELDDIARLAGLIEEWLLFEEDACYLLTDWLILSTRGGTAQNIIDQLGKISAQMHAIARAGIPDTGHIHPPPDQPPALTISPPPVSTTQAMACVPDRVQRRQPWHAAHILALTLRENPDLPGLTWTVTPDALHGHATICAVGPDRDAFTIWANTLPPSHHHDPEPVTDQGITYLLAHRSASGIPVTLTATVHPF